MSDKVCLKGVFGRFDEAWSPKVVGEVNESLVKVFKARGEFVWHSHEHDDEFFLVVEGELRIKLRDREVIMGPGECFVVPKGVEHMPYALEEAHVLLFEAKSVINTGDAESDLRVDEPERIV